ncbi:MAG: Crp/Fnr family transcriptional regulator [Gammaproteobacteria bacterium]|nr:MAG: Crp/Fnr family transcriptional regulator [Gammaproteobacteria bacterium]
MSQEEVCQILKRSLLFSRLSEDQLERVCKHAKRTKLKENETLFAQGDEVHSFYLVISGSIKLFRLSPDGQEKIIEITNPGNTFAEALMFLEHPHYPVYASALVDSEVIGIDAKDFARMLRDSVDTCFVLMADMSQRLHGLIREIDDLSLHSGTCRVASYLLKHAPEQGDNFNLDIPKGVIAARLSVKPETFSRIIKNLSEKKIITVHGSEITIHDRNALSVIAEL